MARPRGGDGWGRRFDTPISIDGSELATLRDAIAWLAKRVPKARHEDEDVQLAARLLTWSAEQGGIVLMAEWAVRRVASAGHPKPPAEPRRKRAKAYRIVPAKGR